MNFGVLEIADKETAQLLRAALVQAVHDRADAIVEKSWSEGSLSTTTGPIAEMRKLTLLKEAVDSMLAKKKET